MGTEAQDVTISVVVDEEIQQWLKAKARETHRSVSAMVRVIIEEYRENEGKIATTSPKESGSL